MQFLSLVLVFGLLTGLHGRAQSGNTQFHPVLPQPIGQGVNGDNDDESNLARMGTEKQLRALNAERQKSLVADTNKLLRLVSQLNAEVASEHPAALTPEQLRKIAEIEKLAHSVKDKMSTSVRGTPAFQPPFQPVRN
jgi:hypothetical protein